MIMLTVHGGQARIELDTLYNFYMHGGMYVGTDVSTYESFKVAEMDKTRPLNQHLQAVCRERSGSSEGMGILEMLIIGAHEKSGLKTLLDMHP